MTLYVRGGIRKVVRDVLPVVERLGDDHEQDLKRVPSFKFVSCPYSCKPWNGGAATIELKY
jgi:hypothetical protein